jgi:hypothetical protein
MTYQLFLRGHRHKDAERALLFTDVDTVLASSKQEISSN